MTVSSLHNNPNGDGHALQFWEPRRALTLDAARRHSAFVRQARYVLIGFAVLLAAMLAWYFIQAPKPIPPTDNPEETVKMVNPVYKGRTSDGLPFRLTASDAVRFVKDPDEVKLSDPVLNFLRSDSVTESVIVAASGVYDSANQVLELNRDVNLETDDGYTCDTSHARVFVKGKRIEGDEPIACTGEFGVASGNAYEINDNYTEYVFKNGMKARIVPEKAEEALDTVSTVSQLRGIQE